VKKILFIASYRKDRAPSQRFRFEQYLDYLNANGFECHHSPLIATPEEDKIVFGGKSLFKKSVVGIKMLYRRWSNVLHRNDYDIIFISREAFKTGSDFFERQLKKSRAKIVYDFDDAIWIEAISKNNAIFRWLKDGSKTSRIISLADLVFAGNQYLADYASPFNKNVVIIPTTIDTNSYKPPVKKEKKEVVIGWSGSVTTIQHFQYAIPALKILKERYKDLIKIKVIGDEKYKDDELGIQGLAWNLKTELEDLSDFDIGLMPLPDNQWTWGKCGLKGLQYMALEVPTIMSPVGVNNDIIRDGVNGYLANETEEWVEKISRLIEDPALRVAMGKAGRQTIVDQYSLDSQKQRYKDYFNGLLSK